MLQQNGFCFQKYVYEKEVNFQKHKIDKIVTIGCTVHMNWVRVDNGNSLHCLLCWRLVANVIIDELQSGKN